MSRKPETPSSNRLASNQQVAQATPDRHRIQHSSSNSRDASSIDENLSSATNPAVMDHQFGLQDSHTLNAV
jgi:hypothetical protein